MISISISGFSVGPSCLSSSTHKASFVDLYFYYNLGFRILGLKWALSPLGPILGSKRGEGTPPLTNPSRHLRKEGVFSHLSDRSRKIEEGDQLLPNAYMSPLRPLPLPPLAAITPCRDNTAVATATTAATCTLCCHCLPGQPPLQP